MSTEMTAGAAGKNAETIRMAEAAAETARIQAIRAVTTGHAEIEARAIAEGWDATKAELEVLLASRPSPHVATGRSGAPENGRVLEAAALMAGGIQGDALLKAYGEQVVSAADRAYRGRIGLQQLILEGAWAAGCEVKHFRQDPAAVIRAAFSTSTIPGILSNVANKFLLDGFRAVDQGWERIASVKNVRDFKTATSYRLTGSFTYEEIPQTGQIPHATASEEVFSVQAKTYGRMFAVSRADLINDDLGALTQVPRNIGRGGALRLNLEFWKAFLNNSTFFTTARKNSFAGAGTALSIAALTQAEEAHLEQTDADGAPIGIAPKLLLVPPGLKVIAEQLYGAQAVNETTTANAPRPANNPHAGKYEVVATPYLSNATITGHSARAWYLLTAPADLPVIEVAFLDGVRVPTVEQAEAEFDYLGIRFRGYFDFGVALQDWRAGVRMKGEA